MKPKVKSLIEQEMPQLLQQRRALSQQDINANMPNVENVDSWFANDLIMDEDIRNGVGEFPLLPNPMYTTLNPDTLTMSPFRKGYMVYMNYMRRQAEGTTEKDKLWREFVLACCEQMQKELDEMGERIQMMRDLTNPGAISSDAYREAVQGIRDRNGDLTGDDYKEAENEFSAEAERISNVLMTLGNAYEQIAEGGEINLDQPSGFDYTGLFQSVAQREEFQEFSDLTAEKLSDAEFRQEFMQSSRRITPRTIDFSMEIPPHFSQEEIERQMQGGDGRVQRLTARYGLAKQKFTEAREMAPGALIQALHIKQSIETDRGSHPEMEAEDALLIQDIAYLDAGNTWFRNNIEAAMDKSYVQLLQKHEMDVWDVIHIGEETARQKYGKLVEGLPPSLAEQEMRALFMADMLRAEQPIQIVHMRESEMDENVFYIDVITDVKRDIVPFQKTERQRQDYQKKLDRVNATETFQRNRSVLLRNDWEQTEREKAEKESEQARIRQAQDAGSFTARERETELEGHNRARWLKESQLNVTLPQENMSLQDAESDKFYTQVFGTSLGELNSEYLRSMRIPDTERERLFYIDGKPAFDGKEAFDSKKVRGTIMKALSSGEHRVSLAVPNRDEFGNVEIRIVDVKPDLHSLDGKEGRFQRSRAKKSDALWAKDSQKEARDAQIHEDMSSHLMATLEAEKRKDMYKAQAQKWKLGDAGTAKGQQFVSGGISTRKMRDIWGRPGVVLTQSLDEILGLDDEAIKAMTPASTRDEIKHWREMYTSDDLYPTPKEKATIRMLYNAKRMGIERDGFLHDGVVMEQLLYMQIMNEHPEIHLADLMQGGNPDPHEALKTEAGQKLAEKMSSVDGFSQVMADSFKWMSQLDLGKEAEYAAGIVDSGADLPLDERKALLKRPDVDATITNFYAEMSALTEGQWNLYVGTLKTQEMVAYTDEELAQRFPNENQRAFYKGIQQRMTDKDRSRFNQARAVGRKVAEANLGKRNLMLRDGYETASEMDTAIAAEATMLNEQMAERKSLADVSIQPDIDLKKDGEVIEQMGRLSIEDRRRIAWEQIIEERERNEFERIRQKMEYTVPFKATRDMEELIGLRNRPETLTEKDVSYRRKGAEKLQSVFKDQFSELTSGGNAWEEGGIRKPSELFYIDGVRADEKFRGIYEKQPALFEGLSHGDKEKRMEELIEADIMSALLSGENKVDMATLVREPDGTQNIRLKSVEANLHALDAAEKKRKHWYQRLPSSKADRMWKKDEGRTERLKTDEKDLFDKVHVYQLGEAKKAEQAAREEAEEERRRAREAKRAYKTARRQRDEAREELEAVQASKQTDTIEPSMEEADLTAKTSDATVTASPEVEPPKAEKAVADAPPEVEPPKAEKTVADAPPEVEPPKSEKTVTDAPPEKKAPQMRKRAASMRVQSMSFEDIFGPDQKTSKRPPTATPQTESKKTMKGPTLGG